MKISNHIDYKEATRSEIGRKLGIPNIPNDLQLGRMKLLAEKVFEPLREHFGKPIYIHSMFRCPEINQLVHGSPTSQHLCENGCAIDMDAQIYDGMTNKKIFDYIRKNLDFDQLILELYNGKDGEWVHCSYVGEAENRKEVMTMENMNGLIVYRRYTDDI